MSLFHAVRLGLRSLFDKRAADGALDDEIRHYLEMAAREHMRAGMSRPDAERAARVQFGGVEATKERVRAGAWETSVETMVRDVRYALRALHSSPAYAFAAISTLGVAIAVTTTLLTVSNTVLRQRWDVPDPARVFTLVVARGGWRESSG